VTLPEAAADRAGRLLDLLTAGDDPALDELLAGLDLRELTYLGAGLTAIARAEGRRLPPAQRAQASTRQVRLGQLRDANRANPEGLRTWLRRAGEEILLIRSLQATADRISPPGPTSRAPRG
jgi:hypothetical protein